MPVEGTNSHAQPVRVGGLSVRASPRQHRAALHVPRFREARWLPASGVRVNSPRSASREDTAAPSPAATIHAPRYVRSTAALHAQPQSTAQNGLAACAAQKVVSGFAAFFWPRKTARPEKMRSARVCSSPLAESWPAAIGRARRPAFAAGAARPLSLRAGLRPKRGRWPLASPCALLSWLAACQPSSPIIPVAAPACLIEHPPSCLKPKPSRAAPPRKSPGQARLTV